MNYITLGSRTLKEGSIGTDVELLQNHLKVLPEPMGSQIKEKSFFGVETKFAVKKFQKYFKLKIDGIVGSKTYLTLGILTGPYLNVHEKLFGSRVMNLGDSGNDVMILQNRLITTAKVFTEAMGYPATKKFDANTQKTVKAFQSDVHLKVDGIAGPRTVYHIYIYAGMGGRFLQKSHKQRNKGYDVYFLQRNLNLLGYYHGKLDGYFGPLTELAVKKLQKNAKIKIDGLVGSQTFYHLAAY